MQAIMQKTKGQHGFTLVELVIAVIVLGALILIALPVYSNVTANAKRRTVEANLKIIDGAIAVYRAAEGLPSEEEKEIETTDILNGYLEKWPEGPDMADYGIENGKAVVDLPDESWAGSLKGKEKIKLEDLKWD